MGAILNKITPDGSKPSCHIMVENAPTSSAWIMSDNPISALPFVERFCLPPGCCAKSFDYRIRMPGGPASAVKHCICAHTSSNYIQYPIAGEVVEQVCIVNWKSEKQRQKLKKKDRDWWNDTFSTQVDLAQQAGDLLSVDHWEVMFDRWNPGQEAVRAKTSWRIGLGELLKLRRRSL